jgi:hypothetical protein
VDTERGTNDTFSLNLGKIQIKDVCNILKMEWSPTLAKRYTVYVPWKPSINIYILAIFPWRERLTSFAFSPSSVRVHRDRLYSLSSPKENPARTYMKMASNNLRVDYATPLL